MPELPDVEIFRRLVELKCNRRSIDHAVVSDVGILEGISAPALLRRLKGEALGLPRRHGKHLMLALDRDGVLTMHFGTNGALLLVPANEPDPPYTRLQLHLAGGDRLDYVNPRRIGRVGFAQSAEAFVAEAELGPDALDPAFDLKTFAATLAKSKRDIKSVLMDQATVAGIGNIYSDEILFQARMHPGTVAASLDSERSKHLFHAMKKVLETAIEHGAGSEQAAERAPPGSLLPERHPGGRCPRCGVPLATVKRGGRTAYFCRQCQPK